jgi:hemoglobin
MRRFCGWHVPLLAGLAIALTTGTGRTADGQGSSGSLDSKALDNLIFTNLREVINHGADLYNGGDWNGCYRLYEGALLAIKPLLAHREKLQKAIDEGLASARQDPVMHHRAFVLRGVIDQIRTDVNPSGKTTAKETTPTTQEPPPAKPREPVVTKPKTLWERLGGEKGVSKLVDDFVNLAAPDPKVDFTRGGKYKPTPAEITKMKREMVEQVSEATGGPLRYEGKNMKQVHKDMGITDSQYDAIVADLRKALEMNNIAPADVATVLAAVNSYRKDVVAPAKKPEEKKPEEKKPEQKKPEEKKPAEKKPEEKKPTEKKPDQKKPEEKKGGPTAANIGGKVTVNGKALPGGSVVLYGSDGKDLTAPITPNGTYSLSNIKPGEYKVVILNPAGTNTVPAAYGDPKVTPLRIVCTGMKGQPQEQFDIAIASK